MTGPPTPPRPLRLHSFEPYSETGGPGVRAVVWLQGCTLGCPGCFVPDTHPSGGHEITADELFAYIAVLGGRIEGVTITGGEPLQQFRPLLRLLTRIRAETALSVLVLTGYSWDELVRMPGAAALRERVDVLFAGRYERDLRIRHGLRGSSNKTVHLFTDRYTAADLDAVPDTGVVIRANGARAVSGTEPPSDGGAP
ncbi:radical SAM protein [Spirillospora sp. NBC_00431]